MQKTPLGLTRLAPGESLSTDNFTLQDLNPKIIDALLQYAAFRHHHDAHAALAAPVASPTADTALIGGTIPADTAIYVGYTLTDADGGETVLNPEPVVVTTQGGLDTPTDAPTLDVFHNTGTLVAGSYAYAVTITDGVGGETALGPPVTVTIAPGDANTRIEIGDLDVLVEDFNGSGYRLWRRVNGGPWGLIASGAAPMVNDNGSLCADCANQSPPLRTGRTNATNTLKVTVPDVAPNGEATSFSIYATTDGTFGNPSLLGTYPVADLGTEKTYTALSFLDGAPPEASLTLAGAQKVNADTEIVNLAIGPPVATAAALPPGSRDGELRVTLDDNALHVWDQGATSWSTITAIAAMPSRATVQAQTLGMALDAEQTYDVVMPKGYRLLKLEGSLNARVQAYTTAAARTADDARPASTPPSGTSHGVILDAEISAAEPIHFTPAIDGWNGDTPAAEVAYVRVTALAAGDSTVVFTYVKTED